MTTMVPTGSLREMMDQLVRLEETIHPDLLVLRWQPVGVPDLPAIWNWIAPSPFEIRDQMRWRDTMNIVIRLGLRHTDFDTEMDDVEKYCDAVRDIVDDALYNNSPLNGTATWARRTGMQMQSFEFNNISVMGVEFPLEIQLDRRIQPNQFN
jgi:hypothetical protein